jgi:hypothetical protein
MFFSGRFHRSLKSLCEPSRWGQTLRSLLWTHTNLVVPSFKVTTVVDLPVPYTFDFNVAATKYFDGLADGDVPICLEFRGTRSYANGEGGLQVAPRWDTAYPNILAAHHGMQVFQLSSKTGEGMNEFLKFLAARLTELRHSRQRACRGTP